MQTDSKLVDDLTKLFGGAVGAARGLGREVDSAVRARIERLAAEFDLVPREEFEAVRTMAQKAREENEELRARLDKLERKTSGKSRTTPPKSAASRGGRRRQSASSKN